MNEANELSVLREFIDALEALSIQYAIGGSVASSLYGQVRFTQDADIAVTPFGESICVLCDQLNDSFYISEDAIRQAHQHGGSFNAIHFKTAFKIDAFVTQGTPFEQQLLLRRRQFRLDESTHKDFDIVSPEDIVLLKLQWFQQGGAISEKQWNDILGVLITQADKIDVPYMQNWATSLRIHEQLEKALQQAKEQGTR